MPDFTSASIILTLIDGIVQMALGPKCAMSKDERKMLQEPLDRIMARFPAAQLAQYGQFVDPLLLVMGLVAWASRISRIRREEAQTGSGKPVPPRTTPPEQVKQAPNPPSTPVDAPSTYVDGIMNPPTGLFPMEL